MSKTELLERLKRLRKPGDKFSVKTEGERRRALDLIATLKKWGQLAEVEIVSASENNGTFTIYVRP